MKFFDPEYKIVQLKEDEPKYYIKKRNWYSFFWLTLTDISVPKWKFHVYEIGYSGDTPVYRYDIETSKKLIEEMKIKYFNSKKKKHITVWNGR